MDDYKEEVIERLNKSFIYQTLKEKCKEKDSEVITLVDSVVLYSYSRAKTIIKHMGEFTLHDGEHLFRVLNLMERILTSENVQKLSIPELQLLILTAMMHDIGMAPEEKDVLAWKKVFDYEPEFESEEEKNTSEKFKRFYSARPDDKKKISDYILQEKYSKADTLKGYLITEFIRITHAERAREIIEKDWEGKILFRDVDLTVEFAQICYSHNEEALSLLELDKSFLCGSGIVACLPLIGLVLRLADVLDFDGKRTPPVLFSHLYVRHPVSLSEWNKHRAIEAWEITPDMIQFGAKCSHPAIEASIHEFCNFIDKELSICNNIVSSLNEFNFSKGREVKVKFPYKVNREKILTKRNIKNKPIYIYRDTKFNLSKKQVIDLLMGTKLYGSSEVALRELMQNSIDACLLRQAQEQKWGNPYIPEISVKYYKYEEDFVLEVSDNGTGMDQYIIDNYYSKIGSSFYKSADFYSLKSKSNADFSPTSRFGIGILSCFMVADTLWVDTKRVYAPHKSSEALNVTVEGQESIFLIKEGEREMPGTTTKLFLRDQNPWERLKEDEFIKSVETIIPNPPFKINIETESQKKTKDENSFQEVVASSMKDFSWREHDNIRMFDIKLDNQKEGILGSATIAILESHGKPVSQLELNSRDVEIEGETYTLERSIRISENSISESSKSITINDDGDINEDDSTSEFAKSKSRLSLHGIEIPSSLFPQSWRMKNNQVKISWPFPLLLVVDVCGQRDLDLNSPRTEIVMSEKWADFEEKLATLICLSLSKLVEPDYWERLKEIFKRNNKNEIFLKALEKIK
jgi:hypothetical protein